MKPKTLFFSSLLAAAAMSTVPAWADTTGSTDSIWINFVSGQGTGATGYTGTWNNTYGASGSVASLKYSDDAGTASGASLTYNAGGTYNFTTGVTDGVLKGYLDDGSTTITVNVSNISYLFYDVTILVASDTASRKFTAKTLNGQTYTSDGNGNGILGSDSWGATQQTSINNNNSFTVSGLYGDLSLKSSGLWTGPRGSVAGLIITDTSADFAVNATISDNSEWESGSLAETTWENATSETHRYANLTLSNSATLNVTGTGITTNAIIATADASGDEKTLTLSGNAVNLIGPGVVRTDSSTANIVIKNTLNFESGGKISGNVSTGEGGLLCVSGGAFNVSASESEDSSLNVSVGEGVSLGISSGTVNITEGTSTISTLTQTGGTLKFSESATATITTANLTGGALSGGNITTANVTSGTVAISGSTIGTLNASGGTVNFSGTGTTTTISGNISVSGGATVEQSAGTVSATRIVLNDSDAHKACFYTLSGGVLNISGDGKQATDATSANAILIGHWPSTNSSNAASVLTVSGGVLNATDGFTTISWDSAGTLAVSDGEANLYGISLNKYRNKGTATFTLSGGRVNLGAGGLTYGNGTAAITSKTATLSGGTLGALEDWSSSVAISVAGDVAIDTTKMSANTDGKATTTSTGATITLSGNITQTAGTLSVSGEGMLDLSGATVSLTSAISNSATVKVNTSTIFVLADALGSDNTYTLITNNNGGSITDWSTLTISNFLQKDGTAFSARSKAVVDTTGAVTITGVAFNLFWNGGTAGTWNAAEDNKIWGKDSATGDATAFAAGDNVTFGTSGDVAVTVDSDGVTARTMTVSAGTAVTLTGGKVTTIDGITVDGALKISSNTSIGGNVTVNSGGTFDVNGSTSDIGSNIGTITLAGGTLTNTGSGVGSGYKQLYTLAVTADSEINGTGNFGLIGSSYAATTLTLNGNTLTKKGSNTFWLVNATVSAGTLKISEGTVDSYSKAINGSAADFVVESAGTLNMGAGTLSAKSLSGAGTINFSGAGALSAKPTFSDWTGTVKITDKSADNFTLSNYGTSGSKIVLSGFSGYFSEQDNGTVAADIELTNSSTDGRDYAAQITNGNSGSTMTFSGSISGGGLFYHKGTSTQIYKFTGDVSAFTGTLKSTTATFEFAGTSDQTFNGSIVGDGTTGANITKSGSTKLTLAGTSNTIGTLTLASGTVDITAGTNTIGTLYSKSNVGTINIGDGTTEVVVSAGRMELGDSSNESGTTDTLNIKKNATLAITGSNNDTGYKNASLLLSEWHGTTTANISGTLLAKDAKLMRGNCATELNVSGGTLAVKGFYAKSEAGATYDVTVNVSDSGKLILGSGDVSGINNVNVSLNNGTLAASESTITFSKNIALTGAGTIDTTKYDFADNGKSISQGAESAAIELTGIISGSGTLKKIGAGTLTLKGSNTLSGDVKVEKGTLIAGSASALGTSKVSVAKDAKLGLVAGTTVSGVTGGIELASGAKLVIDMTGQTAPADRNTLALDLVVGSALKYNGNAFAVDCTTLITEGVVVLENLDSSLKSWVKSLSYADNTLTLTMTVPEPSTFGLLAGVGALALVAARRRRRAK